MAVDWAADVRKYVPAADEGVIAGVVRYCGIALTKRDSSLVSFSDPKELDRVRDGFMKKKLALTESDDVLNAALTKVGERMKADRTKNRVTVYYLLAEQFGKLDMFKKKAAVAKAPAKAAAKPAARSAAKAAPKVAAAATPAKTAKAAPAKAAPAKTVAKPAVKTAVKPAAKTAAKPAPKIAAKAAAPAKAVKSASMKAAPAKTAAAKAAPAKASKSTTSAKVAVGAAAAAGVASLASVGDKTKKAASAAVDLGKDAVSGAAGLAGDALSGAVDTVGAVASGAKDAAGAVASGAKDAAGAAGAAVTGAATAAVTGVAGLASAAGGAAHKLTGGDDDKPGNSRWLWYLFAAVLILAFLWWLFSSRVQPSNDAAPVAAASSEAMAPSSAAADITLAPAEGAVAIPEGDGVTVESRDSKPVVKVYFASGKTVVPNAIDGARAGLKSYLETHAGSTLGVSGFNDASGNADVNAALSKRRAEAVRDVLVSAGIPAASVVLVKPANTTDAAAAGSAARRVEVVVQ